MSTRFEQKVVSDSLRFDAGWFGFPREIPVEVDDRPHVPRIQHPEYVLLEDGRDLTVVIGEGRRLTLIFSSRRDAHLARQYLKETPVPIVRLRLNEHPQRADRLAGALELVGVTRLVSLEQPLVMAFSDVVLDKWIGQPGEAGLAQGKDLLSFCLPGQRHPFAVSQSRLLLQEDKNNQINILAMNSYLLYGRLCEQGGRARIVLEEAKKIHSGSSDYESKTMERFAGGLIELQQGVHLVHEQNADVWMPSCEGRKLLPPPSMLLEAWINYHAAERELEAKALTSRNQPLPYTECRQVSHGFTVQIRTSAEALKKWIPEEPSRDTVNVGQAIVMTNDPNRVKDLPDGTLDRLDELNADIGVARAWISFRSGLSSPPAGAGFLVAVQDRGQTIQNMRREAACSRLVTGQAANPRMLTWLLDPLNARPPVPRTPRPIAPPRPNPDQFEAVARGLGTRDVLLVQGPPGTGKTQVIVELLAQLKRQERKRSETLRILLSSVQNDALTNVVDKIRDHNARKEAAALGWQLFFYRVPRLEDRVEQMVREREQAERIADRLRTGSENHPLLTGYHALGRLDQRLEELEQELHQAVMLRESADGPNEGATRSLRASVSRLLDDFLAGPAALELPGIYRSEIDDLIQSWRTVPSAGQAEYTSAGVPGIPSALAEVLRDELTPDSAAIFIQQAEGLESAGICPEELRLATELAERLKTNLERGRPLDRWQENWELLRQRWGSPAVANEPLPAPVGETLAGNFFRWIARTRCWIAESIQKQQLSIPLVRQRLAEALTKQPSVWSEIVMKYANVLAATCQRSVELLENDRKDLFDYAIIDEAGRASPIDLLIPMTIAEKVILIGDHHQLPPAVEDLIVRRMEASGDVPIDPSRDNLFSRLFESVPPENRVKLSVQYRMHETIGQLVSDLFYEGALRSHYAGPQATEKLPRLGWFQNRPLVWVDTSATLGREERTEVNPLELELIEFLLADLRRQVQEGRLAEEAKEVGVITFYRQQRKGIENILAKHPELQRLVEFGTVDSFQGKEFPVVILSTVKHNRHGRMGFLALPNRINVAFSRAQSQLIILGSRTTVEHGQDGSERGSRYLAEAARRCSDAAPGTWFMDAERVLRGEVFS